MVPTTSYGSSAPSAAALNGGCQFSPLESRIQDHFLSTSSSEEHIACPGSPTPSVGIIAARLMELKPEKDRWRRIARDWYAKVVAEFPSRGKLHHHLGLLSRKAEGEELHAVYHFVNRYDGSFIHCGSSHHLSV